MDHTAPPAPLITFAAKRRYEPPPPKTAEELRREAEWNRMTMLGYEPVWRPRPIPMSPVFDFNATMMEAIMDMTVEYEIEWVRRRPRHYEPPLTAYRPPPIRHRRNA